MASGAGPGGAISTHLVCDVAGSTVARQTIEGGVVTHASIEIAGLGEVRPEEGVFLLRLPVNGTVLVEEARSLATGARIADRTGYMLADARGSVLARTSLAGATVAEEAEYDAWGATMDLGAGLAAPVHQFTGIRAVALHAVHPRASPLVCTDSRIRGR